MRFLRCAVLAAVLIAPVRVLASGSAPGASSAGIQQAAADVATIATSLNTALHNPAVTAAIPGGLPPNVSQALGDLVSLSQALSSVQSATSAQPTVAQVAKDVNTIVNALSVLPLPPPAPTILLAASVLLPVIEGAVGVAVPSTAAAAPGAMNPADARMHLMTGR